jgi:C-terminal processing protease CtpA/Prc
MAPVEDEKIDYFCGPGVALSPGEDGAGARVTRVLAGSPAATVGVAVGDRVLAIDGRNADQATATSLFEALAGPAGTPVSLRVRRAGGEERTIKLVRALLL